MEVEFLYRYERVYGEELTDARISLSKYRIRERTPKGVWIGSYKKRWVNLEAKKRFAYETPEQAMENFIARTKRCVLLMEWQLKAAKHYLSGIKNKTIKITESSYIH